MMSCELLVYEGTKGQKSFRPMWLIPLVWVGEKGLIPVVNEDGPALVDPLAEDIIEASYPGEDVSFAIMPPGAKLRLRRDEYTTRITLNGWTAIESVR